MPSNSDLASLMTANYIFWELEDVGNCMCPVVILMT